MVIENEVNTKHSSVFQKFIVVITNIILIHHIIHSVQVAILSPAPLQRHPTLKQIDNDALQFFNCMIYRIFDLAVLVVR